MVAPAPIVTGATSWLSEPMKASSSMMVVCFLGPIIVTSDHARANVDVLAYIAVTQICEMIGFAAFTEASLFRFNKIPYARARSQFRLLAQGGQMVQSRTPTQLSHRQSRNWPLRPRHHRECCSGSGNLGRSLPVRQTARCLRQ